MNQFFLIFKRSVFNPRFERYIPLRPHHPSPAEPQIVRRKEPRKESRLSLGCGLLWRRLLLNFPKPIHACTMQSFIPTCPPMYVLHLYCTPRILKKHPQIILFMVAFIHLLPSTSSLSDAWRCIRNDQPWHLVEHQPMNYNLPPGTLSCYGGATAQTTHRSSSSVHVSETTVNGAHPLDGVKKEVPVQLTTLVDACRSPSPSWFASGRNTFCFVAGVSASRGGKPTPAICPTPSHSLHWGSFVYIYLQRTCKNPARCIDARLLVNHGVTWLNGNAPRLELPAQRRRPRPVSLLDQGIACST